MSPSLPPEIRVETSRHGVRYLLPPRETGPLKLVAIFIMLFGGLFAGFAIFWILGVLGFIFESARPAGSHFFALFGLPFLAVGLGIIGLGMFMWSGRCEVEVRPGELLARERGGPFWWTRRIPLKDIRRFALGSDAARVNNQPIRTGPLSDVGALTADVGAANPRLVVLGYPRAWVEALAARLTADIAAQTGTAPLPTTVTPPNPQADGGERHGDRIDPPAKTNITLTEQAGGIIAVVPPQGMRATKGLLVFALIWLFCIGFAGAIMVVAPDSSKQRRNQNMVIPAVIVGAFGLIGVGMLTAAVNQMRRKASLRASRDELIVVQQSLFGTKTFRCARGELAAICVGDSGVRINKKSVQELQVEDSGGRKHGFFTNLSDEELHWLATGVGEKA